MASDSCPSCGREETRVLPNVSSDAALTYRRCQPCGHVWVTFANGRADHHVTPLKHPDGFPLADVHATAAMKSSR